MFCPSCDSANIIPERSSGYDGYRCCECGSWNYSAHMKDGNIKTMEDLEHKVKGMIKDYGIDDGGARIINDFLIDSMNLYGIVEMAKNIPESEFK